MTPTEVERECGVDVAVRWGTGYDTTVRSFVNIIATPKGGTHLAGFDQALLKVLRKQVETNARRLKAGNDKVEKDDVARRAHRGRHRPARRAAVRGADQGGARHLGGARRSSPRSSRPSSTALLTSTKRPYKQQAAPSSRRSSPR